MRREARNRKRERKLACAVALSLACAGFFAVRPSPVACAAELAADALPAGGHVAAGDASIAAPAVAGGTRTMTIDQTSRHAIIDWTTFNVGKNAAVTFQTWTEDATGARIIDPTAMTLNRVASSGGLSTIAGRITSTGVFLLTNPNGVLFADGASVDAAGIVVSTAALDEKQFMEGGRLSFVQDKHAPDAAITVNGALAAETDVAQAKAALENAVVNVGAPVGTTLSVANNVIRIVADGAVAVGPQGSLQATSSAAHTDSTTGDTTTREGTIVLRADANADGADGTVTLANADKNQIAAQHVVIQFDPAKTDGTPDFVKGAETATALQTHIDAAKEAEVSMLVNDVQALQEIGSHGNGSYALGCDLFAEATGSWDGGKGFAPIGSRDMPFSGSLDGNGYRIFDLTIARSDTTDVGLFAVTDGARIHDMTLVDARIVGSNEVGGLAGWAKNGTLFARDVVRKRDGSAQEGTSRTGALDNVVGMNRVGGLVGNLEDSTIADVSQNASAVRGVSSVGGLAGMAVRASIIDSSNTGYTSPETNLANGQTVGVVTARNGWAGGLAGNATDTFLGARTARAASYNDGRIIGETAGGLNIGGLVGIFTGGTIAQAYNSSLPRALIGVRQAQQGSGSPYGSVEGVMNVGGLVGRAENGSVIQTAFNAGNVTGKTNVGGIAGLVGNASSPANVRLSRVYNGDTQSVQFLSDGTATFAYRNAIVQGGEHVGGLVGKLDKGTIAEAYSLGLVTRAAEDAAGPIGGLVGSQTKNGATGTAAFPAYFVQRETAGRTGASDAIGTKAPKKSWLSDHAEERTMETIMQKDDIGWAQPGDAWIMKEGVTPPLLRAFLGTDAVNRYLAAWLPTPPDATPPDRTPPDPADGTSSTQGRWDIFGLSWGRAYASAIRDHRPAERRGMVEHFDRAAQTLPRFDGRTHFFTLEDTVLRPDGLPLLGGAQLMVMGTEPIADGTTLATTTPDIVMEKTTASQEKAGNETAGGE